MDTLQRLSLILDILRRECPWDRQQTFESLRYLTIEEVFELSDAILSYTSKEGDEKNAAAEIKKELGDILMHILFYCKIAEERHLFGFDEVCGAVSDKLVARHPHIELPLDDGTMRPPLSDSHPGWEQIKMSEGRKSVLDGVPRSLPSLVQAFRLQQKAEGIGYSEDVSSCSDSADDLDAVGDRLFALVNQLRKRGIDADEALAMANRRYMQRVRQWEEERR